jgi:hypothetical protein
VGDFDGYKFLTTNLLTGAVLGDLEISSCNWKEVYKAPGSASITVRFDAPTSRPEFFRDWASALWIVKDGEILWGGIVGKVQRRGGTRSITIPVVGFLEYFRKRFLRNAQGMTYGKLVRVSDIEWRDIDVFNIFKDVVDHAQSFPDGNLNIGVTWDNLSGQNTTMIYRTFTVKSIGNLMGELSDRLTSGFDFEQRYTWVNGKPKCNFHLMYPSFNRQLKKVLLFQVDRNVIVNEPIINALNTTGVAGSYATPGDKTSITGDIEVTAAIRPDDWTPSSIQTIRSKWGTAGNRSWRFQLLTDGKLRFEWSTDGTAIITEDSDISVSFVNGDLGLVQVRLDVDNGAGNYSCTFWQSTDDGKNWTALDTAPPNLFNDVFGDSF